VIAAKQPVFFADAAPGGAAGSRIDALARYHLRMCPASEVDGRSFVINGTLGGGFTFRYAGVGFAPTISPRCVPLQTASKSFWCALPSRRTASVTRPPATVPKSAAAIELPPKPDGNGVSEPRSVSGPEAADGVDS
jgi:hypothetical protein